MSRWKWITDADDRSIRYFDVMTDEAGRVVSVGSQRGDCSPPALELWRVQRAHDAANSAGHMTIPESARNERLFRIGCAVRRFGVDFDAILATLHAVNTDHCSPALEDAELRTIAASTMRYEPGDAGPKGAA